VRSIFKCTKITLQRYFFQLKTLNFLAKNFEAERKACKLIIQKEKRNYINDLLIETEQDFTQGRIRNFFAKIID